MIFTMGEVKSKEMAQKILDAYCKATGIQNAGVHPDTSTVSSDLGLFRYTRGWAFLLELGSINNDLETVKSKGAKGLLAGIKAVLGKAEDKPFTDLDRSHTFSQPIGQKRGVASGYGDGRLGIDEPLTVGRFSCVLRKYDKVQ